MYFILFFHRHLYCISRWRCGRLCCSGGGGYRGRTYYRRVWCGSVCCVLLVVENVFELVVGEEGMRGHWVVGEGSLVPVVGVV